MCKVILQTTLVLLTVSFANAGLITQQQNFEGSPSFNRTLNFNEFGYNPAYLNSIYISLALSIDGGFLVLDNDGENAVSGTFEFGVKGSISPVDLNLAVFNSEPFSLAANTGDTNVDYDPNGPDGMQYDGQFATGSSGQFISSVTWNDYIGNDSFEIDVTVFQWSYHNAVGEIGLFNQPVNVDGCVTVIYDYTIPEPTTIAILACGAFGFLRKRKTA